MFVRRGEQTVQQGGEKKSSIHSRRMEESGAFGHMFHASEGIITGFRRCVLAGRAEDLLGLTT